MKFPVIIGAALIAASSFVHAQAPQGEGAKPAQSEARKARKAMHAKAAKACEATKGKGSEHRDCMRREVCAQTQDPAKCEARAKEAMAKRDKIREACKGKEGDERRACIKEQRGKT